ncbi:NnrU family protein [Fluviibacterium sp. S390]|uniref:NnrU family protein n=1 Tax=Fluviibacterium sp. S390 TaxID=3415139 RepID=UPI003C79AC8B
MFLLILGLALWIGAHVFKRVAPDRRAGLGEKGKGMVALAIGTGLVLMILGYRGADYIEVWSPPTFLTHVNNLLMLISVYFFGIGSSKGRLAQIVRHPMLTGVKTWAFAHLLVNGDLASILLFGGILGWAVAEVVLINKAEPEWTPPAEIKPRGDLVNIGISLVIYAVLAWAHTLFGLSVFG